MMRYLLVIFFFFFSNNSFSEDIFDPTLQKKLKLFENSCNSEDVKDFYKDKSRPNRLLLIDATDPLSDAQIQYLKDNYITGLDWQNEGEIFSIVVLNSKPISKLDRITMCTPMREDQISVFDARNKVLRKIQLYKQTLVEAFEIMVRSSQEAKSTRLIETLYQIYTNKRFNFLEGDRKLLIASDLLQNSTEVDLYCKDKCPTFEQTYKKKKEWFNFTKLQLRDTDLVELYYLQAKCRVNFATLYWWRDYLLNEGIKPDNLFAKAENNNVTKLCTGTGDDNKPIITTEGESGEPGPRVGIQPVNGRSGFTSGFNSVR